MAGTLYLIDSNVLIRWIRPEAAEFQVVVRSIRSLEEPDDTPCYTSQNLGEFWNVLTRPTVKNGYGLPPEGAMFEPKKSKPGSACSRMVLQFTMSGAGCWSTIACVASRFTMPAWLPPCMCTA